MWWWNSALRLKTGLASFMAGSMCSESHWCWNWLQSLSLVWPFAGLPGFWISLRSLAMFRAELSFDCTSHAASLTSCTILLHLWSIWNSFQTPYTTVSLEIPAKILTSTVSTRKRFRLGSSFISHTVSWTNAWCSSFATTSGSTSGVSRRSELLLNRPNTMTRTRRRVATRKSPTLTSKISPVP